MIEWRQWGGGGGAIAAPRRHSSAARHPASTPKPTAAEQTIAGMGDVKPVTTKEFVADEIPW